MNLEEIKKDLYKIDEQTHLKKTKDSYRLIYPINDSKGNFIWKNLLIGGKWSNLFLILFVVSLLFYLSWGHKADIATLEEYIEKNCQRINLTNNYPSFPNILVDVDEPSLFIPSADNDEMLQ